MNAEQPVTAPKIFKAYDIRGVYGEELDEGIAYLVGRAVATQLLLQKKPSGRINKILVGHDMRTSSQPLRDALVSGIRDQGADVVHIGLCSTPMFYWATQEYEAGVMVTASHNPAKYNGFKMCKDGAFPVGEISGMRELEACVMGLQFPAASREGTYEEKEVLDAFLSFNLSFLKTDKPFKIVIDAGNGMGGYTYGELLKRLPSRIHIIPMYFEPDGTFPNHEANPLKVETMREVKERVLQERADFGLALDGDEDRCVFIDNHGNHIVSDYTTALIAEQVLTEHPGGTILYDIRQSRVTPETILAAGGKPVMTPVGHALIKVAMQEHHAAWGGELSGHFYNAEQQNTENTQIIFFRMMNLLAQEHKTLAELAHAVMHKYAKIDETNFEVPNAKELIALFDKEYGPSAKTVSRIDGIRIDFDEWWFNLRSSNTEPLLRLNLECKDKAMLEEKFAELSMKIGGKIHN